MIQNRIATAGEFVWYETEKGQGGYASTKLWISKSKAVKCMMKSLECKVWNLQNPRQKESRCESFADQHVVAMVIKKLFPSCCLDYSEQTSGMLPWGQLIMKGNILVIRMQVCD